MLAGSASRSLLAAGPALMPMPVKLQPAAGRFPIDANFVVETVGGANARLAPGVRSFLARISRQTGVIYAPAPPAAADAHRLVIDCAGGPEYPSLGEDESYTLDVSAAEARIQSATAEGALRALATFAQLVQPGPDGFQVGRRPHRRPPALSMARSDAGRLPPLDAGRSGQAQPRRHGRRQAQRLPLAPLRRSGLPRREPALSPPPRDGIQRRLLHPGPGPRHRRLRPRPRHPRRSPNSTSPATAPRGSWAIPNWPPGRAPSASAGRGASSR